MPKIIGIDLGTTNSEAAYIEAGRPIIVPSAEGNVFGGKNFPSVVAFTKEGELLVGDTAKRQAITNPERTIMRIKRKMGTDYKVTIDDKNYTPEQISAFILQKIKADAENHLGDTINEVVITVPAYFDDNQRNATKAAGEVAGLKVRRIINEPTAAALAYGLDREDDEGIVAVYDLGGGTFDITIMEMGGGVFEVKSTNGDTRLGGSDMDDAIIDHLAKVFKEQSGIDATKDRGSLQRLRDAAERAKMELTSMSETTINIPYLGANEEGPQHLELKLNRPKLEELVRPIVERTRGPVEQAIKDAKIDKNEIKHVLLVGGPTRMPIVQTFANEVFGQKPKRGVDPMQCVAMGAAIQAGVLSGDVEKEIVLLDVTPLTLGLETLGNVKTPLIDRNTTIPTSKTQAFSTAADNQTSVEIHILQGERPMASDNRSLGRFRLDGIPPAPRGIPQIEVTYDIDANGILHVTAKDKATGKENKITVQGSTKLSADEIQTMRSEAEQHKAEDDQRRAKADARNLADQAVIAAEKFVNETSDKLSEDDKTTLQGAIDQVKTALEGDDADAITKAAEALSKTMEPIVVNLYQQASPPEGAHDPGAEGSGEEWTGKPAGEDPDVVDADFKVKDDGGNGNGKTTSEKQEESKTRDE